LLDTAQVCTLHAFCLRLVREHFHDLHLDPQFTVQDEIQNAILRDSVLNDLFRANLQDSPPASPCPNIARFLRRHARHDLRPVMDLVREVHDYARSLPEPSRWIEGQRDAYAADEPRLWARQAREGLSLWARGWTEFTRDLATREPDNPTAASCLAALELLAVPPSPATDPAPDIAELDELLRRILDAGDRSHPDKRKAAAWVRPLKKLLAETSRLRPLLAPGASASSPSALVQDWRICRHDVRALLDLVVAFEVNFRSARRAAAAVDFADLELLALELLWDPDRRAPTALARQWQEALDLVFVDEYQDINGAQDRILQCLSREGPRANRFLVGDIKQSIYRFRRADPRIFQEYARRWRSEADGLHAVAPLTENFRSHGAILDFVNSLFRGVMLPDVGGVAYDDEAELRVGAPNARPHALADRDNRIELHLLPTGARAATDDPETRETADDASDEDDDADVEERQARLTARRLRLLHDEALAVRDGAATGTRPVRWRDMVVLHPAPRVVSERWARAFAAEGVPLDARRGGFFEATEVSDLIHLVRLLDNPRQDISLLAVLRSPLVGMNPEELAALRFEATTGSLWTDLIALERNSNPRRSPTDAEPDAVLGEVRAGARAKAGEFLDAYRRWRRIATRGSLAACLETVLAETAYEAWLMSRERADARRANLRRLLGLTRQFDTFQRHGLFRFVRFLEAQAESADRTESAPAASGDSVRLLSMHQSKGLEFPVVVAAGLGRRFNTRDVTADWLIDPDFGICPPIVPDPPHRRYSSLSRHLAGVRRRQDLAGEQIRLLYVACTRAAERLLLVGACRESQLASWSSQPGPLGHRRRVDARSPLDWIGPFFPSIAGRDDLFETESGAAGAFAWRLWRTPPAGSEPPPMPTPPAPVAAAPVPSPTSRTSVDQLDFDAILAPSTNTSSLVDAARRLDWNYPWPAATREPAKAAVTALRRQWLDDGETAGPRIPGPPNPGSSRSPDLDRQAAIDRGLAHHAFVERVDLSRTTSRDELRDEVRRLVEEAWLTPRQAEVLDLDALAGFWCTPLARTLRAHPERVQRELPFTLRLRATDISRLGGPANIAGFASDDYQVVQGVIDLAWIGPDEIWIVDFKTDQVRGDTVAARAREYESQLKIYAYAASEIYRLPTTRCWLYFFATGDLVSVAET
ncbi:MAG: UvrD-helicase domain-containing protein, partial [Verrucomicrobiales bacterium]|nr:UvrD-helicase domain-containing protein [Verrucomicrobiales bacterium]